MDTTKLKKVLFVSLLVLSILSAITLCHINQKLVRIENPIEQTTSTEDLGHVKAKMIFVIYESVSKAFRPSLGL